MRERASGKEQVGGRRGERARLEKGKEQGKPLSFYLSPEITLGPSYSYRSLLSSIRDYRNVSSSSTPFPPPENPCRFFPLYFFSFLRFPTNRLADHPFAQTCTIEFNQFFFVCSIRPLYPPPTLSDVSEKCCGMSAFPFFLFLLCVLLLLLASFRRRRRRRRRRSSVAMEPIESDLINLQGELDSELDFAQRKSNAPLHPFSHPCSNPCSIDKMYLLRIYPYREREREKYSLSCLFTFHVT